MIWRFSDVHEGEQYRLHLCASKDGERFFRLVAIGSDADSNPPDDVLLVSVPVPDSLNDLLKRGNLESLSELVPLENGGNFFVEAHGIWLTDSEVREIDSGVNYNEIKWLTGQLPNFPPR